MGKLIDLSNSTMAYSLSEKTIIINDILDGEGSEAISNALDSYVSPELHKDIPSIMNSSLLKSRQYKAGTAQYNADRARWVLMVRKLAYLKYDILNGKHDDNKVAQAYLAWNRLTRKARAESIIANLFYYLTDMENTFNDRGASLVAVAAAYSYLGEGNCDPLAAENYVVDKKGIKVLPYNNQSGVRKMGTGIGFQQWSFYRHDDLVMNANKWSINNENNKMGTILPSPTIQFIFAVKEIIATNSNLVKIANAPNSNINEVLAWFLQIQNGSGYAGVCLRRLMESRGKFNSLDILTDDFKADMTKVWAYAQRINPGGSKCPNV